VRKTALFVNNIYFNEIKGKPVIYINIIVTYEVKKELTGNRDLAINNRHRTYGWNCPGLDLDFAMIEYDTGLPKALFEYKKYNAPKLSLSHPSIKALATLATNSNIPAFIAWYHEATWSFYIIPLNDEAKKRKIPQTMTERNFVRLQYWLRGRLSECTEEILADKKKEIWPENLVPNFVD